MSSVTLVSVRLSGAAVIPAGEGTRGSQGISLLRYVAYICR